MTPSATKILRQALEEGSLFPEDRAEVVSVSERV
jgi:hypothetical protein